MNAGRQSAWATVTHEGANTFDADSMQHRAAGEFAMDGTDRGDRQLPIVNRQEAKDTGQLSVA